MVFCVEAAACLLEKKRQKENCLLACSVLIHSESNNVRRVMPVHTPHTKVPQNYPTKSYWAHATMDKVDKDTLSPV